MLTDRNRKKLKYDDIFILWDKDPDKAIPPRPENPELYPEDDSRHWYDSEFVGFNVKRLPQPDSLGDGPRNKNVVGILPVKHPYMITFGESMMQTAEQFGMNIKLLYGDNSPEKFDELVEQALEIKPDMVLLDPFFQNESTAWFKKFYEHRIPVIACNMIPANEGFRYILSWTGPDAWGESRMLANKLSELMNQEGGYAIVRHYPGSSTYDSRTWSIVTELKKTAPRMKCLAMETSYLNTDKTEKLVNEWLTTYGSKLKGIVSCDDDTVQTGINRALDKAGRRDIIKVSNGSTKVGMDFIRKGELHAICLKSPLIDGATPVKAAADWFNGLDISQMRFLPKHIITIDDVDDMFLKNYEIKKIGLFSLEQSIRDGNSGNLESVFQDFFKKFESSKIISLEYFRGFTIDVISRLIQICNEFNIEFEQIFGSYEMLFKELFYQKSVENTMSFLFRISKDIVIAVHNKKNVSDPIEKVLIKIDRDFKEPISLKVLAAEMDMSPKYLGQLFRKRMEKNFSQYVKEKRISYAEDLLKNTSYSTVDIAEKCGFPNRNYFYTVFRELRGISPSQFRYKSQD
ncbi:helix-turn-helix domain-containing protein [Oceanispirochaeta crateris]|uniref:Helix-turn-helix domain-containing protein n=1 Tax=Oceanispirochaeta crateris TaxID=2518645 RepID=A0A5C1QSA1_9SPIO|nr:substrate-binding domain-containing protein [Oceanispirochaeta crateris]QEN09456.1 helix-turn-helix domain-containing protein [Oceanispirochaeta crateris]